jgi:hypothetical protein
VNTESGICSCKAGENGCFCKHQAFLVQHFKAAIPSAPPLHSTARHNLAKLALGAKCPPMKFFLSATELETEQANGIKTFKFKFGSLHHLLFLIFKAYKSIIIKN